MGLWALDYSGRLRDRWASMGLGCWRHYNRKIENVACAAALTPYLNYAGGVLRDEQNAGTFDAGYLAWRSHCARCPKSWSSVRVGTVGVAGCAPLEGEGATSPNSVR